MSPTGADTVHNPNKEEQSRRGGSVRHPSWLAPAPWLSPARPAYGPETDHALLEALTATTGGQVLAPDDLGQLPQLLPNRSVQTVKPLSERIWDTPLAFALVLLVLTAEWIGRKVLRLA